MQTPTASAGIFDEGSVVGDRIKAPHRKTKTRERKLKGGSLKWLQDPCSLRTYRLILDREKSIKSKGTLTEEDRRALAEIKAAKRLLVVQRKLSVIRRRAEMIRRHLGPKYTQLPMPPNPIQIKNTFDGQTQIVSALSSSPVTITL